jgi:predicted nucleotidyltransferase
MSDLRLRAFGAIDERAVALPHGTEVFTRVAKTTRAGRPLAPGAVGRVVDRSPDGQTLLVHIVGVGELEFARTELTPRKLGQLRYAVRRQSSWDALLPCVVLKTTVGSRAWGLADQGSDTDTRGAFALPTPWSFGLVTAPQDLTSEDGSTQFWSVEKLIKQALRADPNTLEVLFVASACATDEVGQWLLDERDCFVSAEIYGAFGRYAMSQLDKLGQNLRLVRHRTQLLEWLRQDPDSTLDQLAERLATISPRESRSEQDAVLRAKQYIKQLYRSMHDQGLIEHNDFASLVQFAREQSEHDFDRELPRELRPKNAYNLLRLIETATVWLRSGEPQFVLSGERRERLLQIKLGQVPLEDVLREAEERAPLLIEAWQSTRLPRQADVARADRLLRRVQHELARRWIAQVPGPWGTAAPEAPVAQWDESAEAE